MSPHAAVETECGRVNALVPHVARCESRRDGSYRVVKCHRPCTCVLSLWAVHPRGERVACILNSARGIRRCSSGVAHHANQCLHDAQHAASAKTAVVLAVSAGIVAVAAVDVRVSLTHESRNRRGHNVGYNTGCRGCPDKRRDPRTPDDERVVHCDAGVRGDESATVGRRKRGHRVDERDPALIQTTEAHARHAHGYCKSDVYGGGLH